MCRHYRFHSHHLSSALPTFGCWYARSSMWYASFLLERYIRASDPFNRSGGHSTPSTFTRTGCAARGKRHEYVGTNCVYWRVHSPALPETEDEYEDQFALENILYGKLKACLHGSKWTSDCFSTQVLAVFSAVSRMSSEKLRRNPNTVNLLAHTGCGGGILAILLVTLYIFERDALKVLAKHDKLE